jgi:hypothetical protein
VQIRHRDVADRLRTNYSSSAGLNSSSEPSNLTRPFGSFNASNNTAATSSRSNIDQLATSATTTLSKGFKSVKNIIASNVPAFIYKPKADSNYFCVFFFKYIILIELILYYQLKINH